MVAPLITAESVIDTVLAGERVSQDEARVLYDLPLEQLGALADRRRLAVTDGQVVTYIIDRNINYTNVCDVYCKFCAFYRTERDADHYVLTFDELDQKLDELSAIGGVQIL